MRVVFGLCAREIEREKKRKHKEIRNDKQNHDNYNEPASDQE